VPPDTAPPATALRDMLTFNQRELVYRLHRPGDIRGIIFVLPFDWKIGKSTLNITPAISS
jgi:hypothetical protein